MVPRTLSCRPSTSWVLALALAACGEPAPATEADAATLPPGDAATDGTTTGDDAAAGDDAAVDAPNMPPPLADRRLSLGANHSCLLRANGSILCWGGNADGQLGDGTLTNRSTPVQVVGGPYAAVEVGNYNTCAITAAGGAMCWGRNTDGQLGDGTLVNRSSPVAVVGLTTGVRQIDTGGASTCALLTTGGVRCWGNNVYGSLGDGTAVNRSTPVAVLGLVDQIHVANYSAHSCAVAATGAVTCWGWAYHGQLGNGSNGPSETFASPVAVVSPIAPSTRVALGLDFSCATTTTNRVQCWGLGSDGQLGNGGTTSASTPVLVTSLVGPTDLAVGAAFACAVRSDATAACWGRGNVGQLGNGQSGVGYRVTSPGPVTGVVGAVLEVAAGSGHGCARTALGKVFCWGSGAFGQLGNGATQSQLTAVEVIGL